MNRESILLGGGCFWCVESVFQIVPGVLQVTSGYAGGETKNPTYTQICTGTTGHAEVVKIEYDSDAISLEKILEVFFKTHDPTTLNRQGNDIGTQYRSVIYYKNQMEKDKVENSIKIAQNSFSQKIVTEVSKEPEFYRAEEYHQDYFRKNPGNGYCNYVIPPKLQKVQTMHFE